MTKNWQPIETAPKDGTRILLFWDGKYPRWACGDYDMDQYNRKPFPYWSHDQERMFGKTDAKKRPPTHWMPLEAPETSGIR